MENGRPLPALNDGGSTRRNGEDELRRCLDRIPIRLCFGEPRLSEIGVLLVIVGTERDSCLRFRLVLIGVFVGVLKD